MENPTSEEVAKRIYENLETVGLPGLDTVEVRETRIYGCTYKKTKL